ncbi:MAG TPA: signal recognition particle-docking protein FtsY [Myxococcaceae bacterium]|nr:signal recognition particle-docking protein FtsY [Myxococcaceae bacterium]
MTPHSLLQSLLGQAEPAPAPPPTLPPGEPVLPPPTLFPGLPGSTVEQAIAIGVAVLLLIVVLSALLKALRKAPEPAKKEEAPPALPKESPRVEVHLPPSEAEAAKLRAAEEAHREAEELARKRRLLGMEAEKTKDDAERARLEQEAQAIKAREEELKREEYRAKKDAEKEARDRRAREREEEARLREEAEKRAREEEEAKKRAIEEEERKKVEAQAGRTLAQGLDKTRSQGFMAKLNSLFGTPRQVDESVLGELEEVLFTADIGVRTASSLVEVAREKVKKKELSDVGRIKAVIRSEVERILDLPTPRTLEGGGPPHVVMVVGVNGAGKTTTIGKLAAKLTGEGKRVILAAGDTFRAAATEQLDVWAERGRAELVKGPEGGDPGSVVFDAVKKALEHKADVVIADTAGRLHTKAPLMEELKKVKRVIGKALPGAPHEVLLVLDSTNGQNAIQQAKQFHEAVGITGIALTKLDGTAKGGVIIGICDELKIPVLWVGVGEKVADLRRFDPKEFVPALFD